MARSPALDLGADEPRAAAFPRLCLAGASDPACESARALTRLAPCRAVEGADCEAETRWVEIFDAPSPRFAPRASEVATERD